MAAMQLEDVPPGWELGWLVLRVSRDLPGDFVSIHPHAEEALADAHRRGPGHQVFYGRRELSTNEVVTD